MVVWHGSSVVKAEVEAAWEASWGKWRAWLIDRACFCAEPGEDLIKPG
jgi:hypothetical protein